MIRPTLHIAIAALLLALVVRTFLVIGLVAPLQVQGSSMAPTWRGTHVSLTCPACRRETFIGADQLPTTEQIRCPQCQAAKLAIAGAQYRAGDRLVVDRTPAGWRSLGRWDVVVLRQPDDAGRLCVKRLLGLPGETIKLAGGDLYVDGELVRKSLAEQRRLRVALPILSKGLREVGSEFHWEGQVDDGLAYNQRVTRRVNPLRDVMVTFDLQMNSPARCTVEIEQGPERVTAVIDGIVNRAGLTVECAEEAPRSVSTELLGLDNGAARSVTLSLFDRQALLAVGDEVVLTAPLGASNSFDPSPAAIRMTIEGEEARAADFRLWRDVYYETRPRDHPYDDPQGWRLGPDEALAIGDNQAISHDSRSWDPQPGVPQRLLVGRLLPAR